MKLLQIMLLLVIISISIVSAQEYTPSTKTVCEKGVCTQETYSGTKFVYENDQWIPIENASSLKDYFRLKIDLDPDFPIEILDFNYNSITYRARINADEHKNKDIELKLLNKKEKERGLDKEKGKVKHRLKDNKEEATGTLYFNTVNLSIYDLKLKWGTNSTTIELQDPTTENLADTYIQSNAPSTNEGSNARIKLLKMSSREWDGMVKFVNNLNDSVDVLDASLSLHLQANGLDLVTEGFDVSSHYLADNSFSESTTWNTMDWSYNTTAEDTITFDGTTPDGTRYGWNVTSATYRGLQANTNLSYLFLSSNYFGSPGTSDDMEFHSRDTLNGQSFMPKLTITYTSPSGVPPDSTNQSPVIDTTAPTTPQDINYTTTIIFNVTAHDDDNDALYYDWLENGTIVHQNSNLTRTFNTFGMFNITVNVSDYNTSVYSEWLVNVTNKTVEADPPPPETPEDFTDKFFLRDDLGSALFWVNKYGHVFIKTLEGTYSNGEAFVCVYDNGTLYAKDSQCS